jgi:putative ABC transport system permease protein
VLRFGWLLRRLALDPALRHPVRALVQLLAIALGVALGFAVHLINSSALAEFSAAAHDLAGDADCSIIGPRDGFDETVLDAVAGNPAIVDFNPVLALDAVIEEPAAARGRTLPLLGVDALRAARLAPATVGRPAVAAGGTGTGELVPLLDDGVFLSPAAAQAFGVSTGSSITVDVGPQRIRLAVRGELPNARPGQLLATMDIAFAQWHFGRLGRLSRIDLALAPGTRIDDLAPALGLPAGLQIETTGDSLERVASLSHAYRVNLNALALVALFTGAFLVFSLQSQATAARQAEIALLRVLGATRRQVARLILGEACVLGAIGASLGVAAGAAAASAALHLLGGDLGGGYFRGVQPSLIVAPTSAAVFFALGLAAAVAGAVLPANAAAAKAPAPALKSNAALDAELDTPRSRAAPWRLPAAAAVAATAALLLPSIGGTPIFAYLAIGAVLIGTIAAKPALAPALLAPLARAVTRSQRPPAFLWLAVQRLAATPRFAAVGVAGVGASFALMVAMVTMVTSFRASVDDWLGTMLPADLYVRAAPPGTEAIFSSADVTAITTAGGVLRAQLGRSRQLTLDPRRPPLTLLARPIDRADPRRTLPLVVATPHPYAAAGPPPVFVSEATAALYDARLGAEFELPLDGRMTTWRVAGIWRDYARQSGSAVVDLDDYRRASSDSTSSEAALWLAPSRSAAAVTAALVPRLQTAQAVFAAPGEIRAVTMKTFDRSFAVTHLIEVAAIAIGLAGIGATFSVQALARRREFGMLRHLGVTRGQILAGLACESLLATALALLLGAAAGIGAAVILVDVVNPQSFHWTMDLRLPGVAIATLAAATLAAAAATALGAGRAAVAADAVRAVREDW